jgi:hypothetical protein
MAASGVCTRVTRFAARRSITRAGATPVGACALATPL